MGKFLSPQTLDFIQKLFNSWPFIVLILGLVGIVLLRAALAGFIGRLRSAGKGWLEAGLPEPQQDASRHQELVQKLMDVGTSSAALSRERSIKQDIQAKGLKVNDDLVNILIRDLAQTRLELFNAQTYNVIWGSQTVLLKLVNEAGLGGFPIARAQIHFDEVKARFAVFYAQDDLNSYIRYIIQRGLVTRDNDHLFITSDGIEFLSWLPRVGFSEFWRPW